MLKSLESTDQELAIAIKELRDQEKMQYQKKLDKFSKEVPKLNLERVQEFIKLRSEEDNFDSYGEEEEEESQCYQEASDRLSYDLKRYYSERNDYDEFSEEANSDAKKNIKELLKDLTAVVKTDLENVKKDGNLFDYEQKRNPGVEDFGQHNTIDQWEFEENSIAEDDESVIKSDKYMLYDDSSSAGSYYSDMMYEANPDPWVPKLNLGGFKMPALKVETVAKQAPAEVIPQVITKSINLENLKQKDFQDEFMEKYNEFSDSWRELIEKEKRF